MPSHTRFVRSLLWVFLLVQLFASRPVRGQVQTEASAARQVLSLKDCLRIATERNHSRPESQFAIARAEAQHRQALAAYWPQVSGKGGVNTMDHTPNFVFPASNMYIPPQSIAVPGGTANVTIPANAFGPGFPPAQIQLPVSFPGQTINTNAQQFPVPSYDGDGQGSGGPSGRR